MKFVIFNKHFVEHNIITAFILSLHLSLRLFLNEVGDDIKALMQRS